MEAKQWLDSVRHRFSSLDMDQIMSCFNENVSVRYNDLPPIQGKESLRAFLSERYHGMNHYQLSKTLLAEAGETLTVEVEASFEKGGQAFESRILEVLKVVDGKISEWNYVGHSKQR